MLGKAMRIVTISTLAFAICGERKGKTSKTVPSDTSTNRRWLAKSLLLGASVQAATGFPVRPLGPLNGWGIDTINNKILGIFDKEPAARAMVGASTRFNNKFLGISDTLADGSEFYRHLLDRGWASRFFSRVLLDNAKLDAEEGEELLAKINNRRIWNRDDNGELTFGSALEEDIRDFQTWQQEGRERFLTYPKFETADGKKALESLFYLMNYPVTFETLLADTERDADLRSSWQKEPTNLDVGKL